MTARARVKNANLRRNPNLALTVSRYFTSTYVGKPLPL